MPIRNPLGLGPGLLPAAGFQGGYLNRVLSIESDSLIGVWLQNELSGSVSFDRSGQGNDGAYTGVTLGQPGVPGMGLTSPLYDGANDFNNIYSAGLNSDFDGAEGTLLAWAKVSGVGVWDDSTFRHIVRIAVDGENKIGLMKSNVENQLRIDYEAGNVLETATNSALAGTLDFFVIAITWSKTADAIFYYINGASFATDTALGTWVGNLSNTTTAIGVSAITPAQIWSGPIGPVALWNKALTADQVATLSKV